MCVYTSVVTGLAWPRWAWTYRMSTPACTRCVPHEWRSAWGNTRTPSATRPALSAARTQEYGIGITVLLLGLAGGHITCAQFRSARGQIPGEHPAGHHRHRHGTVLAALAQHHHVGIFEVIEVER